LTKDDEGASAKVNLREEELPPSVDFGKKSRGKGVLIALGAVVVFGVAAGSFGYMQNRRGLEATETAYANLTHCLVGEPRATPEEVTIKFRRHQLAFMSHSDELRSGGEGAPWPQRCHQYALEVHDGAKTAGLDDGDESVAATALKLSKTIKELSLTEDNTKKFDAFYAAANAAKLQRRAATSPAPPTPPPILSIDDVPDTSFIRKEYVSLRSLAFPIHRGPREFFFVDHHDAFGPFTCDVLAEKTSCRRIAEPLRKLPAPLLLLASSDHPQDFLVFAGERGKDGIFRAASGEKVDAFIAYGGHMSAEGGVSVVGYQGERVFVATQSAAAAPSTRVDLDEELKRVFDGTPPERGNSFYNVQLTFGRLLVRGFLPEQQTPRLYSIPIKPKGALLGKPTDLGPVGFRVADAGPDAAVMLSCKDGKGRVHTRVHGDVGTVFFDEASKPSGYPPGSSGNAVAWCRDDAMVLAEAPYFQLCGPKGCVDKAAPKSPSSDFAPRAGSEAMVVYGDEVLRVWAAAERGGIRGQLSGPSKKDAPTASKTDAPSPQASDFVLFEDLVEAGKVLDLPTVTELRLIPLANGSAVLLMQTKKGLVSMRITSERRLLPDTVEWLD
jgi:hypothetical protein